MSKIPDPRQDLAAHCGACGKLAGAGHSPACARLGAEAERQARGALAARIAALKRLARSYVLLADLTEDAIQGGAVFTLRSSSDGLFAATLQHPGSPQTGPRYCVVRGTLGAVLAELDTKWREWQRRGNQP